MQISKPGRSLLLIACAILFGFGIFVLTRTKTASPSTDAKVGFDEKVDEISKKLTGVLNSLPGKPGLGDRIDAYNQCYIRKDWEGAYSLKSKRWRLDTPLLNWKEAMRRFEQIFVSIKLIASSPIVSGSDGNRAMQVVKAAKLKNRDGQVNYQIYSELWYWEAGDWYAVGGAAIPWDSPSPPVLEISKEIDLPPTP